MSPRSSTHAPSPPNTADQLRSGAPVRLAGGGTGRHLSLQYGCRPELRQLHPLVRPLATGQSTRRYQEGSSEGLDEKRLLA